MRRVLPAILVLWSIIGGSATASADGIVLSNVVVTVGSGVFDSASVGWSFPVTLRPGESVVLTQNHQGPPNDSSSYNFDLSECSFHEVTNYPCSGETPVIRFVVDGVVHTVTDDVKALLAHGNDSGNEATEFELAYKIDGLEVWLGYADNVHKEPCNIPRCFPTNFFSPTYFQGTMAYRQPGTGEWSELDRDHCIYGAASCVDAAALYFVNTNEPGEPTQFDHSPVPEPSSFALLGIGLLAAVRVVRRRG